MKIAIVGGGASGLICAIFCAKKSYHVDIYEQNSKIGKKILVSGNGKCNITNKNISHYDYTSQNPTFITSALKEFGFKEFKKFIESLGLLLDIKDDGRCYPLSYEAKSVVSILKNYALSLGINIHTDTKITDIKKLFKSYDKVVIATGSQAAPHLGGNDDGIRFAKVFGHTIVPTYPALVQFEVQNHVSKMAGAKIEAEVTLIIDNKKEMTIQGDILFTTYGISGFAILDISTTASLALLNSQKVDISLNLLPMFSMQQLSSHIQTISKNMCHLNIENIISSLIPLKMTHGILKELDIHTDTKSINTKLSKKIANKLLAWHFNIKNTHGYRHAEVSGGGVDTAEINPKTMQSLKEKNLYFCGEVLDIVGRRGGYNFAWAWASGYVCAKYIN
jgi:predicted Rossmann fold flavoprotein